VIDLKLLRDSPDIVREAYARRGGVEGLDRVIELDAAYRLALSEVESMRAEANRASKGIGQASPEERPAAITAAKQVSDRLKSLEPELEKLATELESAAAFLPNLPHESVPTGVNEADNVIEREVGDRPRFDFEPKDHVALGESLALFDGERGAKVSGSRFVYLTGNGVILELALVRFALDLLAKSGFKPMAPPVLVREQAMYGTGFFPAEEFEIYRLERDDLYLIGTSEVSLAAYHAEETLAADDLPIRYAGYSPCFRREAGSYGKETKGLIRVHQFEKVEQFSLCRPEDSWAEFDVILANQEAVLQALELPYRVVVMCGGDLGPPAAKKIDNEAWLPGSDRYMEVTSASNTTDYQSRRLKIRLRGKEASGLVHTLNGTAVAVGRTIVSLLENHQQADGSVKIPSALQPYTGFDVLEPV
jgi:seryl-tRNA synthetase